MTLWTGSRGPRLLRGTSTGDEETTLLQVPESKTTNPSSASFTNLLPHTLPPHSCLLPSSSSSSSPVSFLCLSSFLFLKLQTNSTLSLRFFTACFSPVLLTVTLQENQHGEIPLTRLQDVYVLCLVVCFTWCLLRITSFSFKVLFLSCPLMNLQLSRGRKCVFIFQRLHTLSVNNKPSLFLTDVKLWDHLNISKK